jgi:hypothetical protein
MPDTSELTSSKHPGIVCDVIGGFGVGLVMVALNQRCFRRSDIFGLRLKLFAFAELLWFTRRPMLTQAG